MADHNENLKDTLNEEIEHADQKPAEEHYSLNDDRRVKVLSPGMLVAKRFFRNRLAVTGMAILVFMFVFSFIGGLISPYEQDKFFYADKTIRREFAAVIKNTEFRYSSADDSVFGLPAQAQAMLAIQQQKDGFTYRDNRFTLTKEAEDFYSVSVNGQVVGLAYKSVVSPSASDATLSFEFTYQALKAYLTDGADTFTADGKTYTVDESGSVMDGTTEVAYVSPYVVQALMPDVSSRISSSTPSTPAAKSSPTPTSPSSWMRSPPPMRRAVPAAPLPPTTVRCLMTRPRALRRSMISPSTLPPTAGPFCRSRPAASTISIPLPARST